MEVLSHIKAVKLAPLGAGEGRNSQVFLAEDPQLGGRIALKEVPITSFHSPADYFAEAQRLYKSRHPFVVPVMYACCDPDYVRMAMQLFERGSLQTYLDNEGVPSTRQIIKWGQHFLLGLHHIHTEGLIHFDVKPTNILIANDGSAMVADFGQSRFVNSLGVAAFPPLYTKHLPPEAFTQTAATKQADVYQAGLTLYRLCNGNQLFDAQVPPDYPSLMGAVLAGRFPDRNGFLPHVPRQLRRVIRKALNVNAAERYQTAMEMMDALGQVNSLLDWQYTLTPTSSSWSKETISHRYSIILAALPSGQYSVRGTVTNLTTGRIQARTPWCGGPFKNFRQADKHLQRVFREEVES